MANRPFALLEQSAHGLRLVTVNAAARRLGLGPGLPFTDARARVPDLVHEDADMMADQRALSGLALWLMRFSPKICVEPPDGVLLDVTGCSGLWGGEEALLLALQQALARAHIPHRLALAGTVGAASALARHGPDQIQGNKPILIEPTGERAALAHLPMRCLRLGPYALRTLTRFGLVRVGQLYGLDRKALERRFHSREASDAVLWRLDQALGQRSEPFVSLQEPMEHRVVVSCPEPLIHPEGIAAGLDHVLGILCFRLGEHQLGARQFAFSVWRTDGELRSLTVRTALPVRDAAHVRRLFKDRLEQIDPGLGIDAIGMQADRVGPFQYTPTALDQAFATSNADPTALASLADRLVARIGPDAVQVAHPVASHIPERSQSLHPFDGRMPDWDEVHSRIDQARHGARPMRLLSLPEPVQVIAEVPDGPPAQFVWRRVMRRVVRSNGPERIAPEWWRHLPSVSPEATRKPRARDYYQVEDQTGHLYWLVREGLYDDERGGAPRWFIHGVFA